MANDTSLTKTGTLTLARGCVRLAAGVLVLLLVPSFALAATQNAADQWTSTGSHIYRASGNIGIGTTGPVQQLELTNSIAMAHTVDSTTGVIYKGGYPFLHDFVPSGGSGNVFLGINAGNFSLTSGASNNIGLGDSALIHLTSGSNNMAIGNSALGNDTDGKYNVALGSGALAQNQSGWNSVAIGAGALSHDTESDNTAVGADAAGENTSAGANTALGRWALQFNKTGRGNLAVGVQAGQGVANSSDIIYNVFLGAWAGSSVLTGADRNLMVGSGAGSGVTTGSDNVLLGFNAGDAITTGAHNIILGYDIDAPSNTGSDQLSIGNLIFATGGFGTGTTIGTGNVGIGTSGPQAKFEVDGNIYVQNANIGIGTTGPVAALDMGTGAIRLGGVTNNTWPSGTSQWSGTIGSAISYNSANVGIGTTGPAAALDMGTGGIRLGGVTNTAWPTVSQWSGAAGSDIYYTAAHVGIGASGPLSQLTVGNTPGVSGKLLTVSDMGSPFSGAGSNGVLVSLSGGGGIYMNAGGAGGVDGKYEAYGGELGIGTMSAHPLSFFSNNAKRITIDTGGSVGINSSVPAGRLDVAGDVLLRGSSGEAGLVVTWDRKIGIGTTAPSTQVDIEGTMNTEMIVKSSNTVSTSIGLHNSSAGAHNYEFYTSGSGNTPGRFGIYDATMDDTPLAIYGGTSRGSGMYLSAPGNTTIGWSSDAIYASAPDTSFSRLAAKTVTLGSGTQGDYSGTLITSNIGIGTTAPVGSLEVDGNVYVKDANIGIGTSAPAAALDMGTGGIRLGGVTNTTWPSGTSQWSGTIGSAISYNSANVGIGTTGPVAALDMGTGAIRLGGVTNTTWPSGSSQWSGTIGSDVYYNSANVGIGSAAPQQKLDVEGTVYFGNGNVGVDAVNPRQKLQVVGNFEVSGASSGAKSYRFRTDGGALDFEASGTSMYYSVWSSADYGGLQRNYMILDSGGHNANVMGDWKFWTGNSPGGTPVFSILGESGGNVGISTATPVSTLQIQGSFAVYRTGTAGDVSSAGQSVIGVTDTTSARTITLATADMKPGRIMIIKDETGAAATHNITVATEGTEKIDGQDTITITANYGVLRVYSDGSNWFTF